MLLVSQGGPVTSGVNSPPRLPSSVVGLALAIGGNAVRQQHVEDRRARPARHRRREARLRSRPPSDQADLSAAYRIRDQDARGWYVTAPSGARRAGAGPDPCAARGTERFLQAILGGECHRHAGRQAARSGSCRPRDVSVIESNDRRLARGRGSVRTVAGDRGAGRAQVRAPQCGRSATRARES